MATTAELDARLNQLILSGKAIEGFDELYADDVVMQENSEAPRVGKAVNREYELQFFGSIETFHGASLGATAASGDVSFSEWTWDVTFKNGFRMTSTQVAVRRWRDGKIVSERFFYNKG